MTSSKLLKSVRSLAPLLAFLSLAALLGSTGASAQDCENTPEGRICKNKQAITAGVVVDADTQKKMGLVIINGGCSGTLLNQYWVLTARHCITQGPATRSPISFPGSARTVDDGFSNPLVAASAVQVTADWAPGQVGTAQRIYDFQANTNALAANVNATRPAVQDIVLIYLGTANLGPVDSQRIYLVRRDMGNGSVRLTGRLTETDTVTQYGRGFSTFATDGVLGAIGNVVTPPKPATGLGTYRSAQFKPSSITADVYTLVMNNKQVGHGGDSGGPSFVTVNGVGVGIAGVQSSCGALGYAKGASNAPGSSTPGWEFATGIGACQYIATEPFLDEILRVTKEAPPPPDRSQEIADRSPLGKNVQECAAARTRNDVRCMGEPGCIGEINQIYYACNGQAAKADYEITQDRSPLGKTVEECATARARNEARCMGELGCIGEINDLYYACNGQAAKASYTDAEAAAADRDPTGKTLEQCASARVNNEARCAGDQVCIGEINNIYYACNGQAQAALYAAGQKPADQAGAPPPAGGRPARAILPVEVFDAPNGTGKVIGELAADTEVTILADSGNDWFEITGENVPTGHGYVYSGDAYRSLEEE